MGKTEVSRTTLYFVLTVPPLFIAGVWWAQSSRNSIPDHGDWFTDMYMIVAGRNFVEDGFWNLKFTQTHDHSHRAGLDPYYYLSLPSATSVVLGLLLKMGIVLPYARLFPLCVTATTLLAVSGSRSCRSIKSRQSATIASASCMILRRL